MNTKIKLLGLTSLALVACGDNKSRPDAASRRDSSPEDAYCSDCPVAPTIGAMQIDRMGRPAINTALNRAFNDDDTTVTDAAKDAYNADTGVASWPATYTTEFAANLAFLDVLDGGLENNGICELGETVIGSPNDCPTLAGTAPLGCGNQVAFSGAGTTNVMAYGTLGGLLANDRLYLDTSKTTCGLYLAVEFAAVTSVANTTCGGRAPSYDVIDFTYSVTALGLSGFSQPSFTPVFGDGVPVHTDLLAAFPYLGAPH